MHQRLSYDGTDAYQNFIDSLKSPNTRRTYQKGLSLYLRYKGIKDANQLLKDDNKLMQADIIDYITSPGVGNLSYSTKHLYLSILKHFYEMNDVVLNWKKIGKYLGDDDRIVTDRAYSREEIQTLLSNADLRGKVILLLLGSAGLRIGALSALSLRNLRRIEQHDIYEITIYEKTRSQYTTYCTPECAYVIDTYLDFRKRHGEKLNPNTPLLREQFDKNDEFRCQHPKIISVYTLARWLGDLLISCGIRLKEGVKEGETSRIRKETMLSHGFRKFANTMMVKANINIIVKERLLGHSTGLEDSYFRPDELFLISQYMPAVPLLTISREHELLLQNQQIEERNHKLEKEKDEVTTLKRELEPLLALKTTLIREGILKEVS
jgi:integrase